MKASELTDIQQDAALLPHSSAKAQENSAPKGNTRHVIITKAHFQG